MNIHRPANTNTLPAESHSHDEVGFRRELSIADCWAKIGQLEKAGAGFEGIQEARRELREAQDGHSNRQAQAWRDAWNSPEMRAEIEALKERGRTEAAARKVRPLKKIESDGLFDALVDDLIIPGR